MTRLLARETHGMTLTSKHEEALLKAEEKQWQAINKDINAEHDEGRADKRVKLVELMHNTIKEREYWINPAERGQKREYKRVAKFVELLIAYKKEAANLHYLARDLRDHKGQFFSKEGGTYEMVSIVCWGRTGEPITCSHITFLPIFHYKL